MSEQANGGEVRPKERTRLDLIDGLRGYAIFHVVIFHYWQNTWIDYNLALHLPPRFNLYPLFATGFLGVELFFFLSGFCLFYAFARHQIEKTERPDWKEFYRRRFLKIYPSYLLAMILFAFTLQTAPPLEQAPRHILIHLLGLHTFFTDTYYSLHPVLWSLSVELQFYLLFPLVCFCFLRRPFFTYLSLVLATLVYRYINYQATDDISAFTMRMNLLPGVLDYFVGGMLTAYMVVWARTRFSPSWRRTLIGSLLFIAGLVSYYYIVRGIMTLPNEPHGLESWQVRIRFPLSLCFMVTTVGGVLAWRPLQLTLANRVLVFLADISYNWFLWHQPIAVAIRDRRILPYEGDDVFRLDQNWKIAYTLLALSSSILFAALVTYGFERPFMRYGIRGTCVRLAGALRLSALKRFADNIRKHPVWRRFLPSEERLFLLDAVRGFAVLQVATYLLWQITWIYLDEYVQGPLNLNTFVRTGMVGADGVLLVAGFGWYYRFARSQYGEAVAPTWREFYVRRVWNLLPLYLLSLASLYLLLPGENRPAQLLPALGAHLFFVQDFSAEIATALNPFYYTVGLAVQFLLLFPLVVAGFRRSPILTFCLMVSAAWAYRWTVAHTGSVSSDLYLYWMNRLPGVLDLFALGMGGASLLAYLQVQKGLQKNPLVPYLGAVLLFIAAGVYWYLLGTIHYLPGKAPLERETWQMELRFVLGLCLAVAIVAGSLVGRAWQFLLANPIFVGLGRIAYPLFLFVWGVALWCQAHRIPYYAGSNPTLDEAWKGKFFFGILGLCLLFAMVLTYALQRPLLALGTRWLRRLSERREPVSDAAR